MTVKEFIIDGIVNYYGGCGADWASDEARTIMAEYESDWFNLPCDPEGATKEQEEEQDNFLESVAGDIMDLVKPFSKDFKIVYEGDRGPDGDYTEYSGEIINAADESMVYDILAGMAGEYGIPTLSEYSVHEIEK